MTAHNCCSNYTRSRCCAPRRPRPARGCRRSRTACRSRPAPGSRGARSSRAAPDWRWRSTAPASCRWPLRGGHRPRRHQRAHPGLGLLRRRHRLDERAGPDRRTPSTRGCARRWPWGRARAPPSARTRRCAGTRPRPPLATLHGEGKVSTFPAIGYTSPNQSHFTSRHFYEIGELEVGARTGWLGPLHRPHGHRRQPAPGPLDGRHPLADRSRPRRCRWRRSIGHHRLRHVHPRRRRPRGRARCTTPSGASAAFASDSAHMTQVRRATTQTTDLREQLATFERLHPAGALPQHPLRREALGPGGDDRRAGCRCRP